MIDVIRLAIWGLLTAAAVQDICRFRISNRLCLAIVALYPAWLLAVGFQPDVWENALSFVLALMLGLLAYHRGLVGGGDVKFFAAAALWFDLRTAAYFLLAVTVSGGLFALAMIFLRRLVILLPARAPDWAVLKAEEPIPYGVAIATGGIVCSVLYGFHPVG